MEKIPEMRKNQEKLKLAAMTMTVLTAEMMPKSSTESRETISNSLALALGRMYSFQMSKVKIVDTPMNSPVMELVVDMNMLHSLSA